MINKSLNWCPQSTGPTSRVFCLSKRKAAEGAWVEQTGRIYIINILLSNHSIFWLVWCYSFDSLTWLKWKATGLNYPAPEKPLYACLRGQACALKECPLMVSITVEPVLGGGGGFSRAQLYSNYLGGNIQPSWLKGKLSISQDGVGEEGRQTD